jgi:hypothetical protein
VTKVVLHIGIALFAFAGASAASGAQVQALGSAQVQILGPESIFALRPESAASPLQKVQGHSSMRRTVSRRKARMDSDGHLIAGAQNVELITINVE